MPLSAAAEFHRQIGHAPTEVFGSTETGGIAWRRQEGEDVWTTMPGINITSGEGSSSILRSPFLSATPNSEPWHMDDALELLPDGRFRLTGRLDRIVKIEEKRLSLPELETRLEEHPWAVSAAAVALIGRRQYIGAAIVLNADGRSHLALHGRRATTQILRRHLSMHFEAVLLPRRWRFPAQLPINERGKLTQAALAAMFCGDLEVGRDELTPA
jgi:acyl-coenzyme A synthetase/AMP-(fatty) acid ligase